MLLKQVDDLGITGAFSKALDVGLTKWEDGNGEDLLDIAITAEFKNPDVYRFFGRTIERWEREFGINAREKLESLVSRRVLATHADTTCDNCGGHVIDGACIECGEVAAIPDPEIAYKALNYSRGEKFNDWTASLKLN